MSRREREHASVLPLVLVGMALAGVVAVALRIAYELLDYLARRVSK